LILISYSLGLWSFDENFRCNLCHCIFFVEFSFSIKHGFRHRHYVDIANVKIMGHQDHYVCINLYIKYLNRESKYLHVHLNWTIYFIKESSKTIFERIWPLFIYLLLKKNTNVVIKLSNVFTMHYQHCIFNPCRYV
jgi:hypothetical protein